MEQTVDAGISTIDLIELSHNNLKNDLKNDLKVGH